MFRGLKKPQILLALIISLSVPILSGYLLYCDLADDNLFSPDAKYENADIDDLFLVADCQNQLKFFGSIGSNALFPLFLPETNAIEQVFRFCSLSFCLEQKTLVLRC
jgi:hypothetical protein